MASSTHVLCAILVATTVPADAATFEFYEGNNCTQTKLGSIDTGLHTPAQPTMSLNLQQFSGIPMPLLAFVFWRSGGWNDEARSVRVTSKWRTRSEYRRADLSVWDHPRGPAGSRDDYVRVIVDDVRSVPERGVCVGSFENNFNRGGVRLERFPQNGIDGKISRIVTKCDANCQNDKVGPQ